MLPPPEYVEAMSVRDPYARWLLEHEARPYDLERLRELCAVLAVKLSVAIVVDDFARERSEAVAAALAQAYPVRVLRTSEGAPAADSALRFNAALALADEDVVAFCDPDVLLAPDAAFEAVLAFAEDANAAIVYGDRDTLEAGGGRSTPLFLPDWSPETFLSQMYTGRLLFYRRAAVVAAGGFRSSAGCALHYDLALRISEAGAVVAHRPRILAHELAADQASEPGIDGSAAVLAEALVRRARAGEPVAVASCPGTYIVRYRQARPGCVEIIVPTRDLPEALERCLASTFERNPQTDLRVTVVDNGSVEPRTMGILQAWRQREPQRFQTLRMDEPFNFSRLVNAGVRASDGPYILLLNNDTEFLVDGCVDAMLEYAQFPEIGAVGAKLLYPDGSVQHAGVVVGLGGAAGHLYRGAAASAPGPGGALAGVRNYSAVTGACLMVRREALRA